MTILFCKIGWMENYCGQTANDQIQGGGSYVKEHGIGHEVCNLRRILMMIACMVMFNQ